MGRWWKKEVWIKYRFQVFFKVPLTGHFIFTFNLSWNSNTLATWCKELTHWKNPDAGKDWRQEEKGTTEDEMVGWHHGLDGHEFEQAPGVGDGQGSLCAAVHGITKNRTWVSNWTDKSIISFLFHIRWPEASEKYNSFSSYIETVCFKSWSLMRIKQLLFL